jgi:hypothetical protein
MGGSNFRGDAIAIAFCDQLGALVDRATLRRAHRCPTKCSPDCAMDDWSRSVNELTPAGAKSVEKEGGRIAEMFLKEPATILYPYQSHLDPHVSYLDQHVSLRSFG